MCEWCNEIEGFGHYGVGATRPRLKEARNCCDFYTQSCRDYYMEARSRWYRDELRRIPKRDPDDPLFKLEYGEGLFASILSVDDYRDWYFLQYLPTYRRRCYRLHTSGEGADAPEERAARGDVLSLQGTAKITNY